ncbi:ligand-gated channel protein [Providencia rettgeri]|uniref:ligand-gated channel protein n=1 Tax=Providencia TaxID=586 RepID=UPI001B39238C|nr:MULTISPECIES: ligand-gated channel protein [Providencia]EHZ7762962.1 ligand-gated channel protein [Providencia rettgeri]EIJ7166104.1 ligand-gated channel protein [Providencia rettgeri]EJD6047171.1 ligand-gated channel protein [Providencia rettgeri]EJD6474755.1 ligand-gated channel protein [Providencia rettgeri]ELR5064451.1 ligand-gated channel protein [Providencia rettgeri]
MVVFNKRKVAISIIAAIAAAPAFADDSNDKIYVTTASGYQQKIEDAPASISVVTREQLETKAYRDVTDALKDVPGVLVTGGGSSSDISIRGMDAKYTMILIDGKRVDTRTTRPNSDNSGIEQGWLPPLPAIERIEVVRGPMSSLYGSDAMGGVINIITRRVQQEWTTSLRADTTLTERKNSGNTGQGSFYTSGPLIDGLLGAKLQGQYSHRGEDKYEGGFNRQIMTSGGGTLSWTPDDKNTFDLDFKKDNQHRDSRYGYSRSSTAKTENKEKFENTHVALTHYGLYDGFSTDTYIQHDEAKNIGRKMKSKDTTMRNQSVFLLGDHSLSVGGQYRKEKLEDEQNKLKASSLDRYSWALFAEDEWLMTNDFALTGGVRMDKDENYGTHWTPRLYGVWHLDEQWTVKGGVSTGYKAPDLRQSSANWGQGTGGGQSNGVIFGNPSLKPEKSVTEEIAVIWNNQENLTASLSIYNTDFKDKITEITRCDNKDSSNKCSTSSNPINHSYDFVSDRTNIGKANMRGIEVTFNWNILDNLAFTNNYTFTDTEQKSGINKGKALNKQPKHMVNSTLTWDTTEDLQTWTRMNFRGKTSDYQGRRQAMSKGTPSYALFDLGASYQLNKNANLVGGVYNVLDRRIDTANYGAELEGRRYNIGINYNF